jgi:hypothetical protein
MNQVTIQDIRLNGQKFAHLPVAALDYLAPHWTTCAYLVQSCANEEGATAQEVSEVLGVCVNTVRGYASALETSGFPIRSSRAASAGAPISYRVDRSRIRWLKTQGRALVKEAATEILLTEGWSIECIRLAMGFSSQRIHQIKGNMVIKYAASVHS